jgi:hypothetical protein
MSSESRAETNKYLGYLELSNVVIRISVIYIIHYLLTQ